MKYWEHEWKTLTTVTSRKMFSKIWAIFLSQSFRTAETKVLQQACGVYLALQYQSGPRTSYASFKNNMPYTANT